MLPAFPYARRAGLGLCGARSVHEYASGVFYTEDSSFDGDLISAKVRGEYSRKDGFDAEVQVQTLNSSILSRVLRVATDPLLKVFEIKLTGPFSDPSWEFEHF